MVQQNYLWINKENNVFDLFLKCSILHIYIIKNKSYKIRITKKLFFSLYNINLSSLFTIITFDSFENMQLKYIQVYKNIVKQVTLVCRLAQLFLVEVLFLYSRKIVSSHNFIWPSYAPPLTHRHDTPRFCKPVVRFSPFAILRTYKQADKCFCGTLLFKKDNYCR